MLHKGRNSTSFNNNIDYVLVFSKFRKDVSGAFSGSTIGFNPGEGGIENIDLGPHLAQQSGVAGWNCRCRDLRCLLLRYLLQFPFQSLPLEEALTFLPLLLHRGKRERER
uniref:Uncharacterized protein MANES_15G026400 n=1 Tax=Rhizophora mucronata TaxID=61149 RepID=A0A2P2LPB8_RHIMU